MFVFTILKIRLPSIVCWRNKYAFIFILTQLCHSYLIRLIFFALVFVYLKVSCFIFLFSQFLYIFGTKYGYYVREIKSAVSRWESNLKIVKCLLCGTEFRIIVGDLGCTWKLGKSRECATVSFVFPIVCFCIIIPAEEFRVYLIVMMVMAATRWLMAAQLANGVMVVAHFLFRNIGFEWYVCCYS